MNCMATLKHIASKNSDYTAIEAYLVYQHDEFSGKVILDKQGRPMLRESYLLDTLECGDFSFATGGSAVVCRDGITCGVVDISPCRVSRDCCVDSSGHLFIAGASTPTGKS